MKKMTLTAMLACIAWATFAQDENTEHKKASPKGTTAIQFGMPEEYINVRDFTYLPDKAKLTIELNNPEQYKELKDIDVILKRFMEDIAFYKDSLASDGGNVRIDYAIDDAVTYTKIRFKKYPADGDIFMNRHNDVARLKIEQDTIRIYVKHENSLQEKGSQKREHPYAHQQQYQLTFRVNSYTDIARIAADKATLQHAFDTLYSTQPKGTNRNPHVVPSSARYNPYAPNTKGEKIAWQPRSNPHFYRYEGLWSPENPGETLKATDYFVTDGNLGVGLVRNMLAPYAEIGFTWQKQARGVDNIVNTKFILRAFVSTHVLFERNASNEFKVVDNMFANVAYGSGNGVSVGLGYLVSQDNAYFRGTTGKMFIDVKMLKKGLTLSPEIIFTNDLKQIYPSLTLKVF